MLKIGTIPVVDEYFIRAIKNALDQMGINPDNLPQKKRRTNLDGTGDNTGSGYDNYFKVTPYEWDDDGKIKHVLISDGGDPSSAYCGMTDVSGFMNRTSRDVAGRYLFIKLVVEKHSNGYFKSIYDDFEWFGGNDTLPGENEPYVLLAEITADGTRVIQRWTGGKIYWRNRFIIPSEAIYPPSPIGELSLL